jgi:hypothetical protein
MADITKNPIFTDEAAARAHLEALRWPNGIVCLHCGAYGDAISAVQKTAKRRKPTSEASATSPRVAAATTARTAKALSRSRSAPSWKTAISR